MDLKHILLTLFLSTLCSAQPDFFYDFGTNNGDTSVEDDDMCVTFNQDFAILEGDIYQTVHFCTNGLFSFGGPLSRHDGYKPPVRTVPFLAAYWYDIDNSESAIGADMIYYRESTAAADLSAVQQDIATEVGDTNFVPTWVAIGTWHETSVYFSPTQTVPDPQPQNTFQIAVATDGTTSYGVLNYGDISSSPDGHNDYPQIGYNAGNDALTGFAPDISGTANAHTIKDGTNVKTTGQYIYLLTTLKPGPVCEAPPVIANTDITPDQQQPYTDSTIITYACASGYEVSGSGPDTVTATCTFDDGWVPSNPSLSCVASQCTAPTGGSNVVSKPTAGTTYNVGETIQYDCLTGYEAPGQVTTTTITCQGAQAANEWSVEPPVCDRVICPYPGTGTNVVSTPSSSMTYRYEDLVDYECQPNYEAAGGGTSLAIECQADKTWSAPALTCIALGCSKPANGNNNKANPEDKQYNYGDTWVYECKDGYTSSGSETSRTVTCQSNPAGQWSSGPLNCGADECLNPDEPVQATKVENLKEPPTYLALDTIDYTCNEGFQTVDGTTTSTSTCTVNNVWNPKPIQCTVAICPIPSGSSNVKSNPTTTLLTGETFTYECNDGYVSEDGSGSKTQVITCTADGSYDTTPLRCERIECPTPTAPANSAISPVRTVYKFGDQLTHKCDAGYSDNGLTDRLIQCRADGMWSGPLLDCQPIMCPQPLEGTNAARTNPSSYTVGMNVTYTCNDNHQAADMSTTKTITCQMDGTWSGTPLVCTLIDDSCKGDADCKSEHGIYSYCEGGSGECLCILGFVMTNGICVDDNECLGDNKCDDANENLFGVEDGTCVNLDGTQGTGYYCSCIAGFIWVDVDPGCKDIDECQTSNAGCADQCTNKFVDRDGIRYECSCTDPTKELAPDKHACIDRTKCAADTCKTLYENGPCGTPGACEDSVAPVDCRNVGGTFQCICDLGYGWDEATKSCKNLNECTLQTDLCEDGCVDKIPHTDTVTYECNCDGLPGYVLSTTDRHNCVDQNECANPNTNSCDDPISTCVNNVGSYTCTCPDNMQWNAATRKCDSVNECLTDNGGCDHICRDGVSGAICSCRPGYSLGPDSKTCTDFNECLNSNDNDCDHICTNTPAGSYTCSCRTGYVLNSDRQSCTDLCALNNGGCEQICNTTSSGTVQCQCWEGYAIMSNGINCGFEYMIIRHEINMPWEPTYGDENHPDNEQLKNDLIAEMRRVYGIQGTSPASAIESYEIMQPFKHDSNSITVDAKVTFVDPVNAEDLSYISYDVFERLQDKEFKFNIRTTDYSLDNTLHFVYRPPIGQEQVWSISATCHFYDQTGVCKSDEECFVSDTNRPECRPKCKDNDSRPECPQRGQLLPMEYIIIIIIIFILICILIIIIACVLNRRKNRRTIIETYSTGTESSMSPMPTMIAPLYKSSSMLYNAPVYGTKQT